METENYNDTELPRTKLRDFNVTIVCTGNVSIGSAKQSAIFPMRIVLDSAKTTSITWSLCRDCWAVCARKPVTSGMQYPILRVCAQTEALGVPSHNPSVVLTALVLHCCWIMKVKPLSRNCYLNIIVSRNQLSSVLLVVKLFTNLITNIAIMIIYYQCLCFSSYWAKFTPFKLSKT